MPCLAVNCNFDSMRNVEHGSLGEQEDGRVGLG